MSVDSDFINDFFRNLFGEANEFFRSRFRYKDNNETTALSDDIKTLAYTHFGLNEAFTLEQLKVAYRERSKELHPDKGGTKEAFVAMKMAYEKLIKFATKECKDSQIAKTTDQTPLHELGLGLGPTTNGKPCKECKGKGYYSEEVGPIRYDCCPECSGLGVGPLVFPCKHCNGTGRYKQINGRVVECRACKGTGKWTHPYKFSPCKRCRGTGKIRVIIKSIIQYYRCFNCKGTGETEVFNIVLPKNALPATKIKR